MRVFTADEANRLLPQVRTGLDEIKILLEGLRDAREQLADLRIVWGDKIVDPKCPDHEEYVGFRDRFTKLEHEYTAAVSRLSDLGLQVKDPDVGLVDFFASRGQELVYLCWKKGEERVAYWHSLEGGFATRRPITTL